MRQDYNSLHLVLKDSGFDIKTRENISKVMKIIGMVFTYIVLILFAILVVFPFYWMIITSLKSGEEIQRLIPTYWPEVFVWSNYSEAMQRLNFGTLLTNTLIVGIFSTLGTLFTTIFAAFAFARLEFRGRDFMFSLLLATMMIPGEMMVISNYTSVSLLGMTGGNRTGAYLAMILPFMISVFYIYLLRQNFKQIPNELYLAAKVDGKSDWAFLWKVMVPLAMPTLTTIFILKLMGTWNAYVWPNLITTGHDELKLISNGLRDSFNTAGDIDDYGIQMAATVVVTVPLLLLFIIFRKYIMRGVGRAGIKG
ncbi:MAG: carbohydrate ABC transporter permease [Firmicutes bacterium]|uniref:Carbohydrate ABC transporter permease n=1 Tax=Candidatus Onthovivens merdipullorum TaxID=2840889 RepID=A0A9D9DJY7_9BACL|nr:carbohydrate ABC transporter permease [Candidatus Onthovivens merdipullorum]